MTPLVFSPPTTRVEHEVCCKRLDQLIRDRNCLIVKRKDAQQEAFELRQQASYVALKGEDQKRRKVALSAGDRRYKALNWTRSINVKLNEWETEFNTHLATYCRALSLPIATDVQTRLPREVRDLVYGHMLDRVGPDYSMYHFKLPLSYQNQPKKMWNIISPTFPFVVRWRLYAANPHYEDSTYVGIEFAKELLQMYYKVYCFTLDEQNFDVLHTFLQQEPRGYGLVVGQMIRNLELSVAFKHCIGMDSNMDYKVKFEETKEATAIQKKKLKEQLEALLMIECRCKIDLNIWIWRGISGLFQFGEVIDVSLPTIEVLKERGCKVDVSVTSLMLASYGSTSAWGTWKILDTDKEPIEEGLKNIMEEYDLPGVEGLDLERVREFEARFVQKSLENLTGHA